MNHILATVLTTVACQQPCTKLRVKQTCGLAMGTVLAALDKLIAEGWVQCTEIPAPKGGKPHACLSLGTKRLWGAYATDTSVRFASVSAAGDVRYECKLPPNVRGFCVQCKAQNLMPVAPIWARCYAYNRGTRCAVVGTDLHAYLPDREVQLGDLPSPMVGQTRLNYAQAFATSNDNQTALLQQEIAQWLCRLWQLDKVVFVANLPPQDAQEVALAALYAELNDMLVE